MPANRGRAPSSERVDIRFRNGATVRATEPRLWRWTLNDPAYPPDYAFDVLWWQPARAAP